MEKRRAFLISAAYYLLIAAVVYIILKYAVFAVMPFIIGFTVAAVLSPAVKYLARRFGMKRKPTAIFLLILFYVTVGLLTSVLMVQLTLKLGEASRQLPGVYKNDIEPALTKLISRVNGFVSRFSDRLNKNFALTVSDLLDSAKSSVGGAVSDISVKVIARLSSFAASVPRFIIELLFAVISSFFFICDFDTIIEYAKNRLPVKSVGFLTDIVERVLDVAGKYFRSYALLLMITFFELLLGLFILRIPNAFALALVIALIDFLPVIGAGAVMIPWAVILLIIGRSGTGMGILLLAVVVTVVRNITEPRIVGKQMGIHPLITLAAMFVGTKLFGFLGLILLPMAAAICIPIISERLAHPARGERDSSSL